MTCKHCGTVYPGGAYPDDRVLKVKNPLGVEVEYPYWEDGDGNRYFFMGRVWWEQRFYLAERARMMGELYQARGERAVARRAVLILNAFATYYPGYLVCQDIAHETKLFFTEPPFPRRGGKWGEWKYEEIPTNLLLAYDSICNSGEVERLGADVRARIENDFFRACVRQDGYHGRLYTNASPHTYEGYAMAGRVLGEPEWVHEAVRRTETFAQKHFFVDGFWCQGSVGYHRYTLNGLQRVFDALRGYSDPPGYEDMEDGKRFDDLDPERDLPAVKRALGIMDLCLYPDGRRMVVHDCWARFENLQVPEQSVSTLLPGMGHAWMGCGRGGSQVQAHLHFSDGAYGHSHADNLNLILFAQGQELVSDLGYTHSRYRMWSRSTLAHNTVLIDGKEQHIGDSENPAAGRLLAFETCCEPVQWMEAGAERAYPGLANVYRRMQMLVRVDDDLAYVVDLFRVAGGNRHDWVMHGSADRDGTGELNLKTAFYGENLLPGVRVRFPEDARDSGDAEGENPNYAFVQNVHRGEGRATVTFRSTDSDVGVKTHLFPECEVFLGDAPSLRRAEENDALLDQYRMPVFLARRDGVAESCFVAVHEPLEGDGFIEAVEVQACGMDEVVLSVKHGGGTDHIVHRVESGEVRVGDLQMQGEVGFVRERAGEPVWMGLWGGTELRWRDQVLSGKGIFRGKVTGVLRKADGAAKDALVVEGDLADDLQGVTAILEFGDESTLGYRVEQIEQEEGETHLALADDPGIEITPQGMRHLYCPGRKILGEVTFKVLTSVFQEA